MQVLRALRSNGTRGQRHPTVKLFLLLQGLLIVLAIYEIVGTTYVMIYGPKERIRDLSKILALIASTLSLNYPMIHWCIFSVRRINESNRRAAHPAAIVYLCLLCCLWIASTPSIIQSAFNPHACNANSTSSMGAMRLSTCKIEKVGAIVAGVMAALSFVLLQFVTCCSQIFPFPSARVPQIKDEEPMKYHHRPTSSRALSDSQTLRPSRDISFMLPKPRPMSAMEPAVIRPLHEPLPTIASAIESPEMDFDPNGGYFSSHLGTLTQATSQTNLLPSPLHPLPQVPDRTTSLRSHPPLQRVGTSDSWSSSVYSRSVSTDFLSPSRPDSPLSSTSGSRSNERSPSLRDIPSRPPTPYQEQRGSVIRPPPLANTMPKMPPSFSRPGPDYNSERLCPSFTQQPTVTSLRTPRPALSSFHAPIPIRINEDSMLKPATGGELVFHACSTPNDEASPSLPKLGPVKYTSLYEQLRKSTQSPKWQGKKELEARLAEARANAEQEKHELARTRSKGAKVSKKRQPSTAF